MTKMWRLRGPFGDVLLGAPTAVLHVAGPRLSASSVRAILRAAATDASGKRVLLEIRDALLGRPGAQRGSAEDVRRSVERIEAAVRAGQFVIVEQRASARGAAAFHRVIAEVDAGDATNRRMDREGARRRSAELVELEHFHEDGAILLLGRAPEGTYRDSLTVSLDAIDVLAACLRTAQGIAVDRLRITGHHETFAQQRADGVAALLAADESSPTAWVDLFMTFGSTKDLQRILEWAARRFAPGTRPSGEPPSQAMRRREARPS